LRSDFIEKWRLPDQPDFEGSHRSAGQQIDVVENPSKVSSIDRETRRMGIEGYLERGQFNL
jgi:hypothetical protein